MSKILELVIDEALCDLQESEIRLDSMEFPKLDSLAGLYLIGTARDIGVIAISSEYLRSHYIEHFGLTEVNEYETVADDEDNDHWGDEYLEGTNLLPEYLPDPQEYLSWKLLILAIIKIRFQAVFDRAD